MAVNRKRGARDPLSRERVLRAAIALADEGGIESLSMRRLGQELGVEAMSLYNHVANKDAILDGIVDLVVAEIDVPRGESDWKTHMRRRAVSAHGVLLRHPWASALMESRMSPSPVRMRYCESAIATLRQAGFSLEMAYNAFLTLDSYVYGFTLQEVSWPFEMEERPDVIATLSPQIAPDEFPNLVEMMGFVMEADSAGAPRTGPGYASEFEFGLDLILDGLERARDGR